MQNAALRTLASGRGLQCAGALAATDFDVAYTQARGQGVLSRRAFERFPPLCTLAEPIASSASGAQSG